MGALVRADHDSGFTDRRMYHHQNAVPEAGARSLALRIQPARGRADTATVETQVGSTKGADRVLHCSVDPYALDLPPLYIGQLKSFHFGQRG